MADTGSGALGAPFSHTFPDHPRHLLEQLNIQRYYGAFCDVTVRIEDYDFKVHQCVLAASCPKLQTAIYSLKHECTTTQTSVLNIKEISVAGFRIVLDFLYTGTLKLDLVQIHDVLSTAQYLEIRQVEKACLDYQYYKGVSSGAVNGGSLAPLSVSPVQEQAAPLGGHSAVAASSPDGYRGGPVSVGSELYHGHTPEAPQPMTLPSQTHPPSPPTTQQAVHPAPVSHPQMSAPTVSSTLAFDTNYIEDYLKLIESLQGGNTEPSQGAAVSSSCSSATAAIRYSGGTREASRSLMQLSDSRYSNLSQLGSPSLPPAPLPPTKHLGFHSATGQPGTYSAEDMRKTILSVLSQERFDDEEEEEEPPPPPPQQQHLDKYDPAASHPPPASTEQSNSMTGSMHGEVDLGPPTLTPEPACVLPSIINIVPHHRRKPPDISEVMPPLSQSVTLADNNGPPAPTLIASCDPRQMSESDHDDNDVSCYDNRTCDADSDPNPNEDGLPHQNACLTNLDETTKEDIKVKINLRDLDTQRTNNDSYNSVVTGGGDSESNDTCENKSKLLKKQKRKKKTPVKLNRQQPMDTDEDDATNILVKHEKPGSVSSAILKKRGRPKKEQTKPLKKRDVTASTTNHERRKIVCDQCGRGFGKQELLNKHKEMHQRALLYACHICGMKYARPAELTRHQRTHSDVTFHCAECNHMFSDPRDFKKHMEHHGVEKPFFCTFPGCTFRSAKPSIVEKHMVIHSGVKMHPCERCDKMFAQPSGLRSHLRSCLQQRSYLCDFCGSSFNHLQSLKSHRMLHTGEKPYFCTDCGARFTDHRNFKRHRRIHDGAFPYACMHCDKNFRHSNSLKAHLKTHGITLSPASLEQMKVNHFEVKEESEHDEHHMTLLGQGHDPTHIAGQVIQVKGEGHLEGEGHIDSQVHGHTGAVTANVC